MAQELPATDRQHVFVGFGCVKVEICKKKIATVYQRFFFYKYYLDTAETHIKLSIGGGQRLGGGAVNSRHKRIRNKVPNFPALFASDSSMMALEDYLNSRQQQQQIDTLKKFVT